MGIWRRKRKYWQSLYFYTSKKFAEYISTQQSIRFNGYLTPEKGHNYTTYYLHSTLFAHNNASTYDVCTSKLFVKNVCTQ